MRGTLIPKAVWGVMALTLWLSCMFAYLMSRQAPSASEVSGFAKPSAEEGIDVLKNGNARFVSGNRKFARLDRDRINETALAQKPFATIHISSIYRPTLRAANTFRFNWAASAAMGIIRRIDNSDAIDAPLFATSASRDGMPTHLDVTARRDDNCNRPTFSTHTIEGHRNICGDYLCTCPGRGACEPKLQF